ncbi:MAG: Gldg family protein, partial [Oscillospiraceae bacterium]
MKKIKPRLQALSARHSSRHGATSAALIALAIALTIVCNLLFLQLPARYSGLDLTASKLYTITDTSIEYLKNVATPVEIHVLAKQERVDPRVVKFIDGYAALSHQLTVTYTDPTVYPSVLQTYDAAEGEVVVVCPQTGKQEKFHLADVIGFDEYAYYTTQQYSETDFDCESLLTSAIDTVLSDAAYGVYTLNDHGETALPPSVNELFRKNHLSVTALNPLTDGGIPADCDLLLANAPVADLADDELGLLRDYLAQGGQVVYLLSDDLAPRPNWEALLSEYGMTVAPGLIADTQRFYQNNPYMLFPVVDTSVAAAGQLSPEDTVLVYGSRGLTLTDPVRASIAVEPFLTSSDQSFAVVDETHKTPGTFALAAVATEEVGDKTARLTVFGSNTLIDEQLTGGFTNLANLPLFLSAVTVGMADLAQLSIPAVALTPVRNTVTAAGIWSALFILILPACVLL